ISVTRLSRTGSKESLWKTGTANLSPYAAPGLAPVPNSYPQPVSNTNSTSMIASLVFIRSKWNVFLSVLQRRVTANGTSFAPPHPGRAKTRPSTHGLAQRDLPGTRLCGCIRGAHADDP